MGVRQLSYGAAVGAKVRKRLSGGTFALTKFFIFDGRGLRRGHPGRPPCGWLSGSDTYALANL